MLPPKGDSKAFELRDLTRPILTIPDRELVAAQTLVAVLMRLQLRADWAKPGTRPMLIPRVTSGVICISIINTNGEEITKNEILAVNWHLEAVCNYGCKFATPPIEQRKRKGLVPGQASESYAVLPITGCVTSTLSVESMLNPHLEDWIIHANSLDDDQYSLERNGDERGMAFGDEAVLD